MTVTDLLERFNAWRQTAVSASLDVSRRLWCTLGLEETYTHETVTEHFEREDLNKQFLEKYNERDLTRKKVSAYDQVDISLIYGFQKSFVVRNKSRLATYRDDCAQKKYFSSSALNIAVAHFNHERQSIEKD